MMAIGFNAMTKTRALIKKKKKNSYLDVQCRLNPFKMVNYFQGVSRQEYREKVSPKPAIILRVTETQGFSVCPLCFSPCLTFP